MALVRDYIACIEELSTISKVLARKRSFLQRLRMDCIELELNLKAENMIKSCRSEDPIKLEGSMVERVDWALDIVMEQDDFIRSILEDLQGSMQAVCTALISASLFAFSLLISNPMNLTATNFFL